MARGRVLRRFPRSIAFVAARLESARGTSLLLVICNIFEKLPSENCSYEKSIHFFSIGKIITVDLISFLITLSHFPCLKIYSCVSLKS